MGKNAAAFLAAPKAGDSPRAPEPPGATGQHAYSAEAVPSCLSSTQCRSHGIPTVCFLSLRAG